ncbi:hypothetical protein DdX_15978 [Ditylenchus destructor]|uniref:Uncharacterized protein n=1 Tax=Ditylenchus destructor TaxID=166010 RepID=A0AAD4QX75_9BILA|nr:hypothetical protein DdX_15978 [Ditylenchus destructor]
MSSKILLLFGISLILFLQGDFVAADEDGDETGSDEASMDELDDMDDQEPDSLPSGNSTHFYQAYMAIFVSDPKRS